MIAKYDAIGKKSARPFLPMFRKSNLLLRYATIFHEFRIFQDIIEKFRLFSQNRTDTNSSLGSYFDHLREDVRQGVSVEYIPEKEKEQAVVC